MPSASMVNFTVLLGTAMGQSCCWPTKGMLRPTGLRPKFIDKLSAAGIKVDTSVFAFEQFGVPA